MIASLLTTPILPKVLLTDPEYAALRDESAHLTAIIDVLKAKNKTEALAMVSAHKEQLKRAYSTIDHIARLLHVPPHRAAEGVELAIGLLNQAYPRCASCEAWITDGPGRKVLDPGHCGDLDGSQAPLVTVCADCYPDAEGIGIGGGCFERARR